MKVETIHKYINNFTNDELYTSVLKSIKSFKVANHHKLEYLVYKLLINTRYSMTKSQIIDELYF